jgi:hypothetical protein
VSDKQPTLQGIQSIQCVTDSTGLALAKLFRRRQPCAKRALLILKQWRRLSNHTVPIFYILLTVHHVMILDKWPTRHTILYHVFIFIFNSLHVSSTSCPSSGETNCVNITSGNCQSMSVTVSGSELPTCTRHGHRHRVTVARSFIDTTCLSWWWARCARNM